VVLGKQSVAEAGKEFLNHAMLSPVRPSVRLTVTRVYHTKAVEVRIMKFSPYGSPIPIVFAG